MMGLLRSGLVVRIRIRIQSMSYFGNCIVKVGD